ncbi:MAG: sugar-binding protein, partial [Coriobacteriaceae bacterium]|nr:sugar-binding protein [Coriobacteriaceae bacterium]
MEMSRRRFLEVCGLGAMSLASVGMLAGCGGGTESSTASSGTDAVANKDKPLVWFNRQPSNSSTGELDSAALNF